MLGSAKSFNFGPFHLDVSQKVLLREGKTVPLAPKALLILSILVENHGKLVEREELMQRVWPGVSVEDGSLSVNIFALRKQLSVGFTQSTVIETVPTRGYRFVVPVQEVVEGERDGVVDVGKDAPGKTPVRQLAEEDRLQRPKARWAPVWVLGTTLAVALAVGVFGWGVWAYLAAPRVLHVIRLTHIGLATTAMTDGTRLYIGEQKGAVSSIAQVPMEGGDPVPIPTPFRNARLLDVLPSRSELLVASFESLLDPKPLWILPSAGGSPRRLGDLTAESAKWSPDGTQIAFEGLDGALYLANSEASHVRKLADLGGGVDGWSPDGRRVRFTRTNQAKGGMSIWEVQSDGTNLQPFLPARQNPEARWGEGQSHGVWTPDGRYFLFREAYYARIGIWAMTEKGYFWPFHPSEPIEVYAATLDIDGLVVGPTGRRLYLVGHAETQETVRYDRGLRQFVPFLPTLQAAPAWSPDQRWIGYIAPGQSLWKARSDGSDRLQLTFPPLQAFSLAWSPDGKRLAFRGLLPGQPGKINIVSAEGGTIETLFAGEPTGENCPFWSRDGNAILFERTWLDKDGNATRSAIFIWDMKTNHLTELPGSQGMACPSWSPDEESVAAHADDNRALSLFDFRSQRWRVIARAGYVNGEAWSNDGRWIFFQDSYAGEDQPIYRVSVPDGKVEQVASRKQLLRADISRYRFTGLDPQDNPLAIVIHRNGDVYALDLGIN